MRKVAITAAIFSGALFMGAASSFASLGDATNTNTTLTKETTSKAVTATESRPQVELASVTTTQEDGTKMVTVESGDYLSKIARKHGTNYQRLFYANTEIDNPDLIFPGQQLRVPTAEERLTARPLPQNAPAEVREEVRNEARAEAVAPAPAPAPTPAPAPVAEPEYVAPAPQPQVAAPSVAGGSVWDQVAQCESGGNWAINTGNGYYGGLQFSLSSWQAVGGSGLPSNASREEQIMRAEKLLAIQGWGAWPACSSKLGLR